MSGKYTCNYIYNSGEVCNRSCHHPEGCHKHWRSKKCILCKVFVKHTSSAPGKYTCNYIHNSGEVCNRGCRRPEGCHKHWRSKKCVPCKVCGKPTSSAPEACKDHAGGFYVLQFYSRQLNKKS
ncbi:hypothetical protein Glove_78g136 [Diversispora epigaea]|uniref:Uncharacterized protein n=1 Tax=Diversispora epigaea TaxID=1348612 RepID=A0A397JCY0_9GLOM|nr:hypothetical protein Glove_78g136 [Diversispora epigaea]